MGCKKNGREVRELCARFADAARVKNAASPSKRAFAADARRRPINVNARRSKGL